MRRRRAPFDALLPGTWHIRELDSATWGARLPEAYAYIAEVIDRFDLVAVQEARADECHARHAIAALAKGVV